MFLRPAETWLTVHVPRVPVLEAQQHPGRVVARHVLTDPCHVVVDRRRAERLDLAVRVIALGHERVEVGEDRVDPPADDEPHEVEPVRTDVGDGPQRALARGVEAPVPVGVEQQPVLVVAAGDEPRFTHRAGRDHRRRVLVLGVVADVEAHRVHDAGGGRFGDELGGLDRRHAERLLAHDVLAGGDDGTDVVGVEMVRAGDVHGVDPRVGEQILDARHHRWERARRRLGLRPLR